MKRTTKIEVMLDDAFDLKSIMYGGGYDMPVLMHEILQYGINGFLCGRRPSSKFDFDMSKFHSAHSMSVNGYDDALRQMKNGHKTGHWIWYIFPQIQGLGKSENSRMYALSGIDEARAFLFDHTLGGHLLELIDALMKHSGRRAEDIMGGAVDARKLRSSMTLFEVADSTEKRFGKVLDEFFGGKRDKKTLQILGDSNVS